RLMAQGKHRGKIVVGFDAASRPQHFKVADAPPIRTDATYVVTGGLTGFGWATAQWLVDEGARSLVRVSRRGNASDRVPATLLGSAAQASYVAANRFMEALAALRTAQALPALAIGWGPFQDFGIVASNAALMRYFEQAGVRSIPRDDVFAWLRFLMRRDVG